MSFSLEMQTYSEDLPNHFTMESVTFQKQLISVFVETFRRYFIAFLCCASENATFFHIPKPRAKSYHTFARKGK